MKPDELNEEVKEILEDWQFWVFRGSYHLQDMGLDDIESSGAELRTPPGKRPKSFRFRE